MIEIEHFHRRLSAVEIAVRKSQDAPTFPIYDVSDLPQDALEGQIAIGTDNSINWFDGSWHSRMGQLSTLGNMPQDAVNGQVVIGYNHSLNWYSNDTWYGLSGGFAIGNPPFDAVEGQIVIGNGSLCWFFDEKWYGISG